jgi:hypothetical protein
MNIIELLSKFEENNNVSAELQIFTDGSGEVAEFWDEDTFFEFENLTEFKWACKNYLLKKDDSGRVFTADPVEVKNLTAYQTRPKK